MKRAVVLVDHGSRRAEANAVLERIAELLRPRLPDRIVAIAHMELATPDLASALHRCLAAGAEEIVVQPYFLAPGSHSVEDIPRLVREALAARGARVAVQVTEPLGVHPALVDVVLDRIAAAAR